MAEPKPHHVPWLRAGRRLLRNLVPTFIKIRIFRRLYGFAGSASLDYSTAVRPDGRIVVDFAGRSKVILEPEDLDDFQFHLQGNAASILELKAFLEEAPEHRVFFDVGAHRGFFSHLFCAAGTGTAIAFEPVPALTERVRVISALNGTTDRLHVRDIAVGAHAGELLGHVHGSMLMPVMNDVDPPMQIPVRTLDQECAALGIVPDLVKIDVEGFESEVLEGASTLLRARPTLFLELHLDHLESRGIAPRAIVDRLSAEGYRFETSAGRPLQPREVYGSLMSVLRLIARA